MASIAEITTVPTVVHAEVLSARAAEVFTTSYIVAASAIHVPGMTTTISGVEVWTTEVEIVAMRITGIDAEVPVTSIPV